MKHEYYHFINHNFYMNVIVKIYLLMKLLNHEASAEIFTVLNVYKLYVTLL